MLMKLILSFLVSDSIEHRQNSATSASWPTTWIPECTPKLEFDVKVDGADGVARIILAKDKTLEPPFFVINLGWRDRMPGELDKS